MDHDISIKTQAAEKYLLGELRPAEREAFEEHFFECPECAEDVRLGSQFSENAKAVFRQTPRRIDEPAPPPKRLNWFARMLTAPWSTMSPVMRPALLAAGLAVVSFSSYQNLVAIPALRARVGQLESPQVLASTVLTPSSRSSVPSIAVAPSATFFQLALAPGAVAPAGQYRCDLRSDAGKTLATVVVPKVDPDANLTLLVPAAGFSTGYYDAVLVGTTGGIATELEHYRFAIRRAF